MTTRDISGLNETQYQLIKNMLLNEGFALTKWFDAVITAGDTSVILTHAFGSIPSGYEVFPKDPTSAGAKANVSTSDTQTLTLSIPDIQGADVSYKVGINL